MRTMYRGIIALSVALLFGLSSCDEGKIYPEEKPIDQGRTASIALHFQNTPAWPLKHTLSIVCLGEDPAKALVNKRLLKASSEEETIYGNLYNIPSETKTIAIAVMSTGGKVVYPFVSFPVEAGDQPLTFPETTIDLASFQRIQEQVFNQKCIACHGGSTNAAGDLFLNADRSYAGLVGVKAPHSADGHNYVTPGDPDVSYLVEIFSKKNHEDIFAGRERSEVLNLIRTWIKEGAGNN
ncbi:hypothetical protein [Porphyromonas endodontalis]